MCWGWHAIRTLERLASDWVEGARPAIRQDERAGADLCFVSPTQRQPGTARVGVIVKAEHNAQGSNPRFIVTNVPAEPQELYEDFYCQRGNMENRIKEQQLDMFADRTSCHRFLANQFRLSY